VDQLAPFVIFKLLFVSSSTNLSI